MDKELRILILEDDPADAELVERELGRAKISFSKKRVETKKAFVKELKDFVPHLILADYSLPLFDGMSALLIAQENCPDVPFIFVSGSMGEEVAIETLKSGATDYVLKERLSRLVPAVRRALREADERAKRKRTEEQLEYNAFHDALTDLPNRALFLDRLGQSIKVASRRGDYLFAVLLLDLDRFKIINDALGHMIGDQLLIAVARKLEACLRSGDTVARFGGDEFTILLGDIKDVADAIRIANRIREELRLPFKLDEYEVFTTVSIGIALSATGYDRPEDLLRDADTAMYCAKKLGSGCFEVFDKSMYDRAVASLELDNDLRQAIERKEFQIHYQPIVSLKTSRIIGFEALLRWQHPQRGLVFPEEFLPAAEETGLIVPIGQWVLREACRQTRAWQAQFPQNPSLSISVNLSVKQFVQPNLVEQIGQVLRETGLDACSLKLEILENIIIEDDKSVTDKIQQLRALGVQFCIDDFGKGYSSLSYISRLPLDTLKIDRSLVSGIGVDEKSSKIVQTIINLAYNLGINVTAEGVETAEQLTQLRALKCKYGQGYYFSKPIDGEAAMAFIAAQPCW
jgi:diguanylate cyclase (GGDEF)-like protein